MWWCSKEQRLLREDRVPQWPEAKGEGRVETKRHRHITFSQNIATNIRWNSVGLLPSKIFKRNTLKTSYSCVLNKAAVVRQHNNAILKGERPAQENPPFEKPCTCRDKDQCPLDGKCQVRSVVYRATVSTDEERKEYTGRTAQTFKHRFNSHQTSMRDKKYKCEYMCIFTALSKHVWSPKTRAPSTRSGGMCSGRLARRLTQQRDAICVWPRN